MKLGPVANLLWITFDKVAIAPTVRSPPFRPLAAVVAKGSFV
jgi:hypothetical protein